MNAHARRHLIVYGPTRGPHAPTPIILRNIIPCGCATGALGDDGSRRGNAFQARRRLHLPPPPPPPHTHAAAVPLGGPAPPDSGSASGASRFHLLAATASRQRGAQGPGRDLTQSARLHQGECASRAPALPSVRARGRECMWARTLLTHVSVWERESVKDVCGVRRRPCKVRVCCQGRKRLSIRVALEVLRLSGCLLCKARGGAGGKFSGGRWGPPATPRPSVTAGGMYGGHPVNATTEVRTLLAGQTRRECRQWRAEHGQRLASRQLKSPAFTTHHPTWLADTQVT